MRFGRCWAADPIDGAIIAGLVPPRTKDGRRLEPPTCPWLLPELPYPSLDAVQGLFGQSEAKVLVIGRGTFTLHPKVTALSATTSTVVDCAYSARADSAVSHANPVTIAARWNSPARLINIGAWLKPAPASPMVTSIDVPVAAE
jgi:hypothetical protein